MAIGKINKVTHVALLRNFDEDEPGKIILSSRVQERPALRKVLVGWFSARRCFRCTLLSRICVFGRFCRLKESITYAFSTPPLVPSPPLPTFFHFKPLSDCLCSIWNSCSN
jgi:hypothetical protein